MPVVKFDVTNQDPTESAAAGDWIQAPKGVYVAKIDEINHGFSKDDNGKPDKSRPRLEVIYQIVADADGDALSASYSRIWDYVSFSEAAEWKLDQWLLALGIASAKKRKGQFKTEDQVGKLVKIRVKGDTDRDGEYRAKIGAIFPYEGDAIGGGEEELPPADEEDTGDEDAAGEEEATEEDAWTEEDIDAADSATLKQLVKEWEVKVPKGSKVGDVRQLLKEALAAMAEASEDEDGDEEWDAGDDADDDDVPF